MKRLSIVAASVLSLLGVGFLAAPSAHAATSTTSTCSGIRIHLYLGSGPDLIDFCLQ